jgi:L-fuconolactonase
MGDYSLAEEILEPELRIIDPHHHLWDLRPLLPAFPEPYTPFVAAIAGAPYYTFDQLHADLRTGHDIVATVFMECGAFYRADAVGALKPVGEVEFVNGVAAQSASGLYGNLRACAAIVGHANMLLGDSAAPVLESLIAAGNGRFRGIRHSAAWDADPATLGPPFQAPEGLLVSDEFQAGFAHLGKFGLTFDAWVLEPQLPNVIALARKFPNQPIVLDHCGTPLNTGAYRGKLPENFDRWRKAIQRLGECPNVSIKLGGLAMPFCGMPEDGPAKGMGSEVLAEMWRPYIETCIESFGPSRAMFESNYPVDRWGATYPVLWNAFKRITSGASADEKHALYAGSAANFYQLEHLLT